MNDRPIKLTDAEKMWMRAEMLTFAADQMQSVREGTKFDADAQAKKRVDWIEQVVLSGKSVDDDEFQGS